MQLLKYEMRDLNMPSIKHTFKCNYPNSYDNLLSLWHDNFKIKLHRFIHCNYMVLYPIYTLPVNLLQLSRSLIYCHVLLNPRKWKDYNRFNSIRATNSLTYWTMALNIQRFGFTENLLFLQMEITS